jgi:adhesin HecA-like repeat protein
VVGNTVEASFDRLDNQGGSLVAREGEATVTARQQLNNGGGTLQAKTHLQVNGGELLNQAARCWAPVSRSMARPWTTARKAGWWPKRGLDRQGQRGREQQWRALAGDCRERGHQRRQPG